MKSGASFTKVLAALAIVFASASFLGACSEYTHLWRPILEESNENLSPESIALFVDDLIKKLPASEAKWFVCINPAAKIPDSLQKSIASGVALLENPRLVWHESLSPFSENSKKQAAIWLDFVEPVHQYYWWRDDNKPPLAMFRSGELDTSIVRVLVRDSNDKIILIEEFKLLFLLESDFMLPGWIGVASAWPRRLSLQPGFKQKRFEWTFSVPPDPETVNQTPSNVERFYFGETPSDQIGINSNY